jgi:hypothetical protein
MIGKSNKLSVCAIIHNSPLLNIKVLAEAVGAVAALRRGLGLRHQFRNRLRNAVF